MLSFDSLSDSVLLELLLSVVLLSDTLLSDDSESEDVLFEELDDDSLSELVLALRPLFFFGSPLLSFFDTLVDLEGSEVSVLPFFMFFVLDGR